MNTRTFIGIVVVLMVLIGMTGCDNDNPIIQKDFALTNFSNTGCKSWAETRSAVENPSYFELTATENGGLYIKHVNVFFNCASNQFDAKVSMENQSITVTEMEIVKNDLMADCICPFDLGYEIGPLVDGETYDMTILTTSDFGAITDDPALTVDTLKTHICFVYSPTLSMVVDDDYLGSDEPTTTQTDLFYYSGEKKIPLTLNENKVLVSVPIDSNLVMERIRANIQAIYKTVDAHFYFFFITRADLEKLSSQDFWEEDAKSVIITPCYYRDDDRGEFYREIYTTPYMLVTLKKEDDIGLLTSYAEKYKLKIARDFSSDPMMSLLYILHVTQESEKSPLECANEMYESGDFAKSQPDFAHAGSGAF